MKNVTYINAGAGSGKTYSLTKTLTQLIKEGKVKPEQVILTTFTTKAANEFREKAKAFLYDEGLYDEAVRLDHAMIGTVHSVCQRMIGKYWFHLGLSPNMGVMAEEDTKYYISQSLAELPTEEELKTLHGFAREFNLCEKEGFNVRSSINYDFWQEHLKKVIELATNYEIEDFKRSAEESIAFVHSFVKEGTDCNITCEEVEAVMDEHEAFLRGRKESDANNKRIETLARCRRHLDNPTIGMLMDINSTIGTPKGYGPLAEAFNEKMSGLWVSKLVYDRQGGYIQLLFTLARRWKENFAQFKREKNLLDYNDMEKYMRLLMQNPSVANEIAQSYRYLFVDEFQDSSPIQVKIFDALSDLMEHSYWVGDYKQAIYGFRGSDIALTKAVVDRVSSGEEGCDTATLDTSWRSLPDIVSLNNAVFEKTFAQVLDQGNIRLKAERENSSHEESLRYFVSHEGVGIAEHVLKMLNGGAKPSEIAVLARKNDTLAKVAQELKALEIPASREDLTVVESEVYPLVASLLRIVGSERDALSKATVAILTERDCTTRHIIEAKLLHDSDEEARREDYLSDVPLVAKLMKLRPRLQQQSVASLVESLVVELNLYDVVKRMNVENVFGISCLEALIGAARQYEEHSVQMNLPATIEGFLAYVDQIKPTGSGDPEGVQLHTYHSCKGLQWKYVILMSLNNDVTDQNDTINKEIYGVHAIHAAEPTAASPYPEVFIRLTPWVYGTKKNVPDNISAKIVNTDGYRRAFCSKVAEANRLLYVGMTRPRDVLIIDIENSKSLLRWPKGVGLTVADAIPEGGDWDVFGTSHAFKCITLTADEAAGLESYGVRDEAGDMPLAIGDHQLEARDPRNLSPSGIHAKGEVTAHQGIGQRIPFAKQPSDMATVGDSIHQVFAGIEEGCPIGDVIASYGLEGVLCDAEAITQAWKNLTDHLTATFGPAVRTYHERPFRLERDGQTIVGSIDLVWQTAEGDILVDFKTCPMGPTAVLDAQSDHYAGWYAGQLDAYHDALEAAGERVLKRYIYYPVSGLLVEIGRAQ